MWTRRTLRWLLPTTLAAGLAISAVVSHAAATDPVLVAAAKNDDTQGVRAQLAKRVNVNEPARDGSTALLWAVYNDNLDMTRALLAAGRRSTRRITTASRRCCRRAARATRRSCGSC